MAKRNDKQPEKTDWRRQAREIADSLAIAFILAMVIRHFVLEVFKIPTKSMQPTLLGDPYTGDKILVNKFAFDFSDPQRWDVMVFKYPEDTSRNYIKRVAGLPGETLRVFGGDVYTQTGPGERDWQIARKRWKVQEALWRRRRNRSDSGSYWLPGNAGAWDIHGDDFKASAAPGDTERLVYQSEVLAYDAREFLESRRPFVRMTTADLMVQFHLVPDGAAEVDVDVDCVTLLGLGEVDDRWTVRFATDGQEAAPQLIRGDGTVQAMEAKPVSFTQGKAHLVQVCNVDDSIIARVDGRRVLYHEYKPLKRYFDTFPGPEQRGRARLGCRGGTALFRDPAIFVDVHYTNHPDRYAVDEPHTLKDDEFFVLGDNSANSNDSRAWGVVPRRYLVGEAFLVLWPLGRMRLVR